MFGVLCDVSGSMEATFSAYYDKRSGVTDDKVKRSHGIITTLSNIVNQEIAIYKRSDQIFVCAFGLNTSKCQNIDTCDFVSLLENRKKLQECEEETEKYSRNGHKLLIQFAKDKEAPHAEPWITDKLSQKEAGKLYKKLTKNNEVTKKLLDLIPHEAKYDEFKCYSKITNFFSTLGSNIRERGLMIVVIGKVLIAIGLLPSYIFPTWVSSVLLSIPIVGPAYGAIIASKIFGMLPIITVGGGVALLAVAALVWMFGSGVKDTGDCGKRYLDNKADNHEALRFIHEIVRDETEMIQSLKPHFTQDVSNLLITVLQENKEASSSSVHEFIDSIKPYVYGRTPMVKALRNAKEVFDNNTEINPKVLFILSDGLSTDGDPTYIAQELQQSNVTIATCYLTSESIPNPKRLVDEEDPSWSKGPQTLYRMSSTMKNTNAPITHLVDYGWELPLSGKCRLFLQASSLDVVEEFCKVAVSQLTHGTDALVHMLGRLSLTEYINQSNDDFKAQQQIGATCYANAIAAVFHLAMHRIVDREGGIPGFKAIRSRIIREYGKEGANTEIVVKRASPEYRLKCHKINEEGARKAINERRPVVARFSWKGRQKEMFKKFYEGSPKAILSANDIAEGTYSLDCSM